MLIRSRSTYNQKLAELESDLSDLAELTQSDLDLAHARMEEIRPKVEEVRNMKESLKQAGQPWQAERQLKISTKFQQICQNARELKQKQGEIMKIQNQLTGQFSQGLQMILTKNGAT